MEPGAEATVTAVVADGDTAIAQGSGNVPVLATPRVIALCEAAAVKAVEGELQPGETTVGARIEFDHTSPTSVGSEVTATAELTDINGRRLAFNVTATQGEKVIGRGTHYRAVVDEERFLSAL